MRAPESCSPERLSPAHRALREATHAIHARLNRHPLLKGITRRGYPPEYYVRVLVAYWHAFRQVDASVANALGLCHCSFEYSRRLPWLLDDLRALGIDPDAVGNRPTVRHEPLRLEGQAELVGALYAIEGSSLGGQVIYANLARTLRLTTTSGARFFHGYGEQTSERWRRFGLIMAAELDDECKRAIAAGGATAVFNLMERTLDDYAFRTIG